MKKCTVFAVMASLAALFCVGCTTSAKGPSDEEMVAKRMQDCITAIKAKKFDAFKSFVSPAFDSAVIGNRDDLLDYLKNADDAGFLDGIEIDASGAKISVNGDNVSVAPVTASGSFGSLGLGFEGLRENGVWLISNVEPGF